MNLLRRLSWSPYVVGALIGILSWFSFASVDKPLGITTAFEYSAALSVQAAAPDAAAQNVYFSEPGKEPRIDWEWMLVLGVFIGAWGSAKASGDQPRAKVPAMWQRRFGDSTTRRYVAAFIGGALLMFGARLAQGCTSGHGISGALQLAVSSWIFLIVLGATGVAAAYLLYGDGGQHD